MNFFIYLLKHPAFMFYFGVMSISIVVLTIVDPNSFLDAPIVIQIGIVISIVAGTAGMAQMLYKQYNSEKE
jgi:uncharacterized membrane protein YqjE